MRKLLVTCECGQELQVPNSVLGKTGVCAVCGRTLKITSHNARPGNVPPRRPFGPATVAPTPSHPQGASARERFGKAVDLFGARHYGEALAILDNLAQEFPGNSEVAYARKQCLSALRRAPIPLPLRSGAGKEAVTLDVDLVRQVVVHKLLYGETSSVQLEAARIACEYMDLLKSDGAADKTPPHSESAPTEPRPHETADKDPEGDVAESAGTG